MQGNLRVDPEVATSEAGGEAVVIPEVNLKGVVVSACICWMSRTRIRSSVVYCHEYLSCCRWWRQKLWWAV